MQVGNGNGLRFWRDPAWVSLFVTLILQLCMAGYVYGRMADKVDMLEHQNDLILQHLLLHMGEGPAR